MEIKDQLRNEVVKPVTKLKLFNNMCRICLQTFEMSMNYLYDENRLGENLATFADVKVFENDDLPCKICVDCVCNLKVSHEFKKKCEQADKQLRKILSVHLASLEAASIAKKKSNRTNPKSSRIKAIKIEIEDKYEFSYSPINSFDDADYINECQDDKQATLCDRCSETFSNESELRSHIKSKHKNKMEIKCIKCDKILSNMRAYKVHLKTHSGDKPFVCEVCGKAFSLLATLKSHSLIHKGELPFKCPQCPHRARLQQSLVMHIRTHTRERPYTCPHCPATFTTSSNRAKHVRYHSDATPYRCDKCPKAYSRKKDLLDHMSIVHLGVKRHQCNICMKRLASNSSLIYHRRVVHNVKRKYMGIGKVPEYIIQEEKAKETVDEMPTLLKQSNEYCNSADLMQ